MAATAMLPNIKVVICGIILAVILFVATGAGIVMPETYTRIGEMPKVGRPMMQQIMTDETAQAQFHSLAATRRSEEIGRLREQAALVVAEPAAVTHEDQSPSLSAPSDHPSIPLSANVAQPVAEPSDRRPAPPSSEYLPDAGTVGALRENRDASREATAAPRVSVDLVAPDTNTDTPAAMPSAATAFGVADAGPPPESAFGAFQTRRVPAPKEDPRNEAQHSVSLGSPVHNDAASTPAPMRTHFRLRRSVRRHFVRRIHHFATPEFAAEQPHNLFGPSSNTANP
jgi:hypothetical protein